MAPSLISTDVFPGDEMSAEEIGTAASMIRFVGDQVATDSADVVKTWSAIAGSYDAPEAGQLVAAMTPVKTSGSLFDAHLGSAADALVTFADEVRTIKKTLEGLRGQANALLATIDSNGKVGAGGIGPGSDWYHDPVTFHHNEDLIAAVAAQAALLKAAESKCAGAIASLADGGGRHGENGGPGFSTVAAPSVEDAPWGHVMTGQEMNELWEREAPGWERGASKQAMATGAGILQYVGFDTSHFDPSTGLPHGPLSTGWSVHNAVTAWEATGQLIRHHPLQALGGAVKDFTAWDDWDHPSYAIGEVGFNLLTLGLASTKVSSVGKLGAAGREAVDAAGAGKAVVEAADASRLARLAQIGQRVGNKITVPTLDGLKTLARTGSDTWSKTLERLGKTDKVLHDDITIGEATTRHPVEVDARGAGDSSRPHAEDRTAGASESTRNDPAATEAHVRHPSHLDAGESHSGSGHSGSGHSGSGRVTAVASRADDVAHSSRADGERPGSGSSAADVARSDRPGTGNAGANSLHDPPNGHDGPPDDHGPGDRSDAPGDGPGAGQADASPGTTAEVHPKELPVPDRYSDLDTHRLESGDKGAWNKLLHKPQADSVYVIDDRHILVTDHDGRVAHVETQLQLEKGDRNPYQQRVAGREFRLEIDQGGHLVATRFGGPGEGINLVAMSKELNQAGKGSWYEMESQWATALKEDPQIDLRIRINLSYPDGSLRPSGFDVRYIVDGEPIRRRFRQ